MRSKLLFLGLFISGPGFGFVHISQLKPRLPVNPGQPAIVFQWNGESPLLTEKEEINDGAFANADDRDLMLVLLVRAVNTWSDVPTAYVVLQVNENPSAQIDEHDEAFSIVIEKQESEAVAAAALPTFISSDPQPSANESDPHIISDCDISVASRSVAAKSLLRTLVHELGHCLGLGHPHSSYSSIMSYSTFDDSASLALDDMAGVSFLYPAAGESEDVRYLTHTCGTVSGASSAPWAGFWYMLPALVFAFRRWFLHSRE